MFATKVAKSQSWTQQQISIQAQQLPLATFIDQLSKKAGFDYAYNAKIISAKAAVDYQTTDAPLISVLNEILPPRNLDYKIQGDQLLIIPKKKIKQRKTSLTLTATLMYKGQYLDGVAVLDKFTGALGKTNSEGTLRIPINNPQANLSLTFSKEGYQSKSLKVKMNGDKSIQVYLDSLQLPMKKTSAPVAFLPSVQLKEKEIEDINLVKFFVSEAKTAQITTLDSLIYSPFQVSLLPMLSSNFTKNAQSVNNFSLNLIAGYSAGTDGAEMGTAANINRYNMRGLQLAGLTNIVGGHVHGLQIAGVNNLSKRKMIGLQVAGINNVAQHSMSGGQIAGINNVMNGQMNGFQISAVSNSLLNHGQGLQLAAFGNFARQNFKGVQFSAVLNKIKGTSSALQVSALLNIAKDSLKGVQLSAFYNGAYGHSSGVQISPFLNHSRATFNGLQLGILNHAAQALHGVQLGVINSTDTLSGLQLGIINKTDHLASGTPIGFISVVKDGCNALELSYQDRHFITAAYKTGSRYFYNIINYGIDVQQAEQMYFGYGFGTAPRLYRTISLNADLTANYVQNTPHWFKDKNFLGQAKAQISYQFGRSLGLFAGASYNVQVIDQQAENKTFIHPRTAWTSQNSGWITAGWWSFQAGIRIGRLGR
ncbi:hypothetical protein PEPS_31640 (plasmid) [Persicobacter psychrovividus]|uniref:Secretin/TonB short N-terminal domain-containing protein n=2 Tax=Persicobacter psychrovividus TaxID=387638 RepID=A0ABM7VIS3_9BACT|nr:hypothetical protein PEPS_31640 [Persicobacter psychrovividus]